MQAKRPWDLDPVTHAAVANAYKATATQCFKLGRWRDAANRYGMINIKLDKTGGLTEALLLVEAVKSKGLELMVGNMGGTSLCIAPAFLVGQFCRFADLDGPLLLKHDRLNPVCYQNEMLAVPTAELWG